MTSGGVRPSDDHVTELRRILEALFEERAATAQIKRLDELVVRDPACRRFYLEYLDLHGNLYWDAAQGQMEPVPQAMPVPEERLATRQDGLAAMIDSVETNLRPGLAPRVRRRWIWTALAAAAVAIIAGLSLLPMNTPQEPDGGARNLAKNESGAAAQLPAEQPAQKPEDLAQRSGAPGVPANSDAVDEPLPVGDGSRAAPAVATAAIPTGSAATPKTTADSGPAAQQPKEIVAFVNARLRQAWKTAGVQPSPRASDSEWLRRVYLDIVGHIPPEAAVDAFLEDSSQSKRAEIVGQLLKEPDYARNWATIWANLLVGRQPRAPGVSRDMLEKFLRDSFASNVPWNEVVYELVSAEGTPEQNPATNFLLAHLNNDAVPATAMTARLLLGLQVQCTQCHDHPFQNDKQNCFWELKSFFQQTEMASSKRATAMGGADSPVAMTAIPELVSRKVGGPVYYETRRGEMRVAYPIYAGHKIDPGPTVNRRRELAKLIAKGNDRQVALAIVNRTWQHFFGYGFTRPVDDMGPHNPPSNPEVLDRLADEFIAAHYDFKQLCRWICLTDAYQRTSVVRSQNRADDPATGTLPSFSRVYLKPMTAEQLYDSLLVATWAKSSARTDWNDAGRRRQDWVRQFVINYGTDENDEATVPAGSVSQALLMMNDSIVRSALAVEPGTLLDEVAHAPTDDAAKIRRLCRSALSRDPRPAELDAALAQLRNESAEAKPAQDRQLAEAQSFQDIFWAFLNANEFAFVH
jgi:hypothetical protein